MALLGDMRYGLRMLGRNPGFTAVAVLALGLGIGANTAIFTVVNALLIRSLPFEEADRLVMVFEHNRPRNRPRNVISPANYLDWKARNSVFEQIAAFSETRVNLTGEGDPEEVPAQGVTAEFFTTLRTAPLSGRIFTAADDAPGAETTAIISHRLWQRRFGSDRNVLHRKITLNGAPATIIGVMPASFRFTNALTDLWTPLRLNPASNYRANSGRNFYSIARLKPEISLEQAQSEMTAIAASLEREHNNFNAGWGTSVVPLREHVIGDIRLPVLVLLAAVGCVLLIACANVANLLLARATVRTREIAVRASLGAGRWRVMRQLLTESVVLAVCGGVLGVLIALWGVDALLALSPKNLPMRDQIRPDWAVFTFSVIVSLGTGLLFGIVPALHATRTDLWMALRQGGRSVTGAGRHTRSALVVVEVALSVVLLIGAGLLVRTLVALQTLDPGLDPHNVLTMRVLLPGAKYSEPSQRLAYFNEAISRLRAVPGVEMAAASTFLPGTPLISGTRFYVEGRPALPPDQVPTTQVTAVHPDFFATLRVRLLRGRLFTAADNRTEAPRTFLVNDAFMRAAFPGEEILGKQIRVSMGDDVPGQIVGVVADIHHTGLAERVRPTVYYTQAQLPFPFASFVVRTLRSPEALAPAVTAAVRSLDAELPVAEVRSMDSVFAESVARVRFTTTLLAVFAVIAVVLASVGLYGVLSYSVTQRTAEIGLRMAVGARPSHVLRLVLREGLMLTGVGIGLGLLGAFGVMRVLSALLFNVQPTDVRTFSMVPVVLLAAAGLAATVPARRAARLDPTVALRYE